MTTCDGATPVFSSAAASWAIWICGSFACVRCACCTPPYTTPASTVVAAAAGSHSATARRNQVMLAPSSLGTAGSVPQVRCDAADDV